MANPSSSSGAMGGLYRIFRLQNYPQAGGTRPDADTFTELHLKDPRQYRLTPCDLELKVYGFRQDTLQAAYFRPSNGPGTLIDTIFVVENPIAGYQYTPPPDRASPTLTPTKIAVRSFDEGRLTICAPPLAALIGASRVPSQVWEARLATAKAVSLGNERYLLVLGPDITYSQYGSGECGACPSLGVAAYVIDAKSSITEAFSSGVTVEEPDEWSGEGRNARYAVSDDLRRITFWQSRADRSTPGWQRTEYCFDAVGLHYTECGISDQVEPPKHIHFAE